MDSQNDLIKPRLEKREKLIDKGIDPYGGRFDVSESIATARANPTPDREVRLAGRVLSHRDMGKSLFADIKDSTGENPDLRQETGHRRRAVRSVQELHRSRRHHRRDREAVHDARRRADGESRERDAVEQVDPAVAEGVVRHQGRRDAVAPALSRFDSQRQRPRNVCGAEPRSWRRSASFSIRAGSWKSKRR